MLPAGSFAVPSGSTERRIKPPSSDLRSSPIHSALSSLVVATRKMARRVGSRRGGPCFPAGDDSVEAVRAPRIQRFLYRIVSTTGPTVRLRTPAGGEG